MAYIQERTGKRGTSYDLRFVYRGKARKVTLDASYTRSDAEEALRAVEGVLRSEKLEEPLDRKTRTFFETAPRDLVRRFSSSGFEVAKKNATILEVWRLYASSAFGTVKDSTALSRLTIFNRFKSFFDLDLRFSDLSLESVREFRDALDRLYAPATVSKTITELRSFANWATERGYSDGNPFKSVRAGSMINRSRDFQVPAEWTERILNACPSQSWRTLYCLWRHAGLRQQEPLELTTDAVDLKERRLRVFSPKTERFGESHAFRVVPIVPKLYAELEKQLRDVPANSDRLIWTNRRKGYDVGFVQILKKAGLEKYPKLFQNLRSSCENDWIRDGIPPHVVASWIGHSVKTQEAHYLRVLPEYFDRVI